MKHISIRNVLSCVIPAFFFAVFMVLGHSFYEDNSWDLVFGSTELFRSSVLHGIGYFILFFIVVLFFIYKKDLSKMRWMHWIALLTIPLGYIAGQAGWVVAECGRQPWAIRDMLPTMAAISKLDVSSVQTTFFIFLLLFTVMLIAGVGIMVKAIKKGPDA